MGRTFAPFPVQSCAAFVALAVVAIDAGGGVAAWKFASASSSAFSHPPSACSPRRCNSASRRSRSPPLRATLEEMREDTERLRAEVEELRGEALARIDALDGKLGVTRDDDVGVDGGGGGLATSKSSRAAAASVVGGAKTTTGKDPMALLDGTKWKISLNVGRESGTWMPESWGKDGKRIRVSFDADFTSAQLYEREEFLTDRRGGGGASSKTLRVIGETCTLGPSLEEGRRTFRMRGGGWRATRGDGPMGTDMLRFYVEIGEDVGHGGQNVHVPKGRIYCTCGYFPLASSKKSGSEKLGDDGHARFTARDTILDELKEMERKIESLRVRRDAIKNIFDLDGFKLSREIFKLNRKADSTNERLAMASVREPDRRLLCTSLDGNVGLTKEGGVVCKVMKTYAVEYHILGRFNVAPMSDEDIV